MNGLQSIWDHKESDTTEGLTTYMIQFAVHLKLTQYCKLRFNF